MTTASHWREGLSRKDKPGDLPKISRRLGVRRKHSNCVSKQAVIHCIVNLFIGRFLRTLLAVGLSIGHSLAQEIQTPIALSMVTVRGYAPERFLAGQKRQTIDSTTLAQFRFQSLTDLLALNTPLAFKNYGPGQLTTVSFRGTSANHTAVLWNGININQPMTGQTDFSTIPVAGFDQLSVQYGSAASVVGSDAVGGSVLIKSSPSFQQPGLSLFAGQQIGSFQNYQTQVGARYATATTDQTKWQVAGKTLLYSNQLNNSYPYTERKYYFVEPTRTGQRGLLQDVYFRNQRNQQISLNVWLTDNDLVQSPADTIGRERTRTQNYRVLSSYEADRFTVRTGWFRDVLDYAKGNFNHPSHSVTDRLLTRVEYNLTARRPAPTSFPSKKESLLPLSLFMERGQGGEVRLGAEAVHFWTRVDGYGGQLIQENRADLYVLMRYQFGRWLGSANLRQAFVTGYRPPFTPSFGLEYKFIQQERWQLTAKGSLARSYRVPTLNERYWADIGNPDLRPERGFNKEIGISAQIQSTSRLRYTAELTTYHNRVDDWTYWNPARNYRVENIQQVLARGIEWQSSLAYTTTDWHTGLRLGYAITRSTQEKAYSVYAPDVIGKQLVYVPLHTGTVHAFVQYKNTRLSIQNSINSRQYITFDNIQALPAYVLTNVLAERPFSWKYVRGRIQGQINNVFDVLYLNVKRNAMPGRNYALSLFLTINTNRNANN